MVNPTLRARIVALLLFASYRLAAQTVVPFTSDQWEFGKAEHTLGDFAGKPGVLLKQGEAFLKGVAFRNGIIEFDVAFPPGRAFVGVSFRVQDKDNFENFYLRAHQSGNPDATQYMPLFKGRESWQLYHGEGYSAAVNYVYNQWQHVKLVVQERQMEVYVGDMNKPVLFVPALKRPVQAGSLGIRGVGRYANFSYTPLDQPSLVSVAQPLPPMPAGTITAWQVSDAFPEKSIQDVVALTPAHKKDRQWQTLPAEPTGIVNLAVGPQWTKEANTTFARVVIVSDRAQTKKLRLGFSDRARVYLNDQALYAGHDEFRSRDYRFLGTLGYWDEVFLPLRKGRNELWVAVSEDFGGWGIRGAIADPAGITVE
ncbi:MAG: hypothetical protein ICV83_30775 [Cytophagales bacterium]|nr:hypothetical protein [Cytophagales bacterium]